MNSTFDREMQDKNFRDMFNSIDYEDTPSRPGPMITLTFDLGDELQEREYHRIKQADAFYTALNEISDMLRSATKYDTHPTDSDKELTEAEVDLLYDVQERFQTIVIGCGADIS